MSFPIVRFLSLLFHAVFMFVIVSLSFMFFKKYTLLDVFFLLLSRREAYKGSLLSLSIISRLLFDIHRVLMGINYMGNIYKTYSFVGFGVCAKFCCYLIIDK